MLNTHHTIYWTSNIRIILFKSSTVLSIWNSVHLTVCVNYSSHRRHVGSSWRIRWCVRRGCITETILISSNFWSILVLGWVITLSTVVCDIPHPASTAAWSRARFRGQNTVRPMATLLAPPCTSVWIRDGSFLPWSCEKSRALRKINPPAPGVGAEATSVAIGKYSFCGTLPCCSWCCERVSTYEDLKQAWLWC